jgi:hypothetical protein
MPKAEHILREVNDKDSSWAMHCLGEILEVAVRFPEKVFLETIRIKICEVFYCSPAKPFPQEVLDQPIWRGFGKPVRTLGYYWTKIQIALQDQPVISIPEDRCIQATPQTVTPQIDRIFTDEAVADAVAGAVSTDAAGVLHLTDQNKAESDGGGGADVVPITRQQEVAGR